MKTSFLLFLTAFISLALHAAEDVHLTAVMAADDARVAAMKSADESQLKKVFSGDLRYAHSNGVVDSKDSLITILKEGRTKYVGYDHVERNFTFPAPGIALMAGRTRIQAETATGKMDSVLSYLAVWRQEDGQWRFLAWQSCKLPPAAP
ncbi:uncharacterized protein DUF4440 [Prosthecobacter fusiformis]|uniref:Uncharacterized protein DUF4440 n=1 Tax=Prosthecobacter fusiformis TaxID=48464 RepID=A0A4R7SSB3_9BACT|nr:nuclear transport factor 2 family protein [Prosthecobacter fusiformis]TDU81904.1 uncharacterized protein DUF4440 [Prosthecobacter fusiformis]